MRISLGTKISLLTSILVFFSVGILGYFLYQNQKNYLIVNSLERTEGAVRLEAAKIEESILELVSDVRFLAKTPRRIQPISAIPIIEEG